MQNGTSLDSATWPTPTEGDFTVSDFHFACGSTLPELRLHYRTLGTPKKDSNGITTNAVLIMHGTTGSSANFFRDIFAGELFNPGQLLSASDHYLIFPDGIGHGGSSKPSDGLHARFPRYSYTDMIRADHMLLTQHLGVNHLRLVMGTSMGGMHSWLWGTMYPDFMDALMPLASLPCQISGRNRMTRKMAIDAIRTDPEFHGGDYKIQPRGLTTAMYVLAFMGSAPLRWQAEAPDWESADRFLDEFVARGLREKDANDLCYAFDASWDYNPRTGLKDIRVPLIAVNFADDQVNPPELRILETEIEKVKKGKAIVVPISEESIGHGTHTKAVIWMGYLEELLRISGK